MRLSSCLLLALLVATSPALAAPQKVTTVEGITEYRLDNGLKVLLFPDASNPTLTVNITYRVGSRHEGRGEAGMAHLLEHMLFKGTHEIDSIWKALQDHGAWFNGTTWYDRTNYFEGMPSTPENLDFALKMEADRMINSRISAEELAKEFSVVRNEFEMGENSPDNVLVQQMVATAYLWHGYGRDTIGNRSDIERVPADALRAFYERYYQPDNAMLVVAGDFKEADALALIEKYYGVIPRPTRSLADTYTVEPEQDGPRHVELQRVGDVGAAGLVYHISAGSHPDYAALELWSDILLDNPTGRLYRAVVETGKASSVWGYNVAGAEPAYFTTLASIKKGEPLEPVLDTMKEVVQGAAQQPVTADEVERARTRLLKQIELSMKDSASIGIQLSDWEAMGDWRLFFLHRDRIKAATSQDVQRVATHYFRESNRTSGIFRPTDQPQRTVVPEAPDVSALLKEYAGGDAVASGEAMGMTTREIEAKVQRSKTKAGLKVALLPKQTRGDAVEGRLTLRLGDPESLKGQYFVQSVLGQMLLRGTTQRDHAAMNAELDRLKAVLWAWAGNGVVTLGFQTDRAHLPELLRLIDEVLRQPGLQASELEIVRKEMITRYEDQLSDPSAQANLHINRTLNPYPQGDVRYVPTVQESIDAIKALSAEDLVRFHKEFYGASTGELVVVGDFDPAVVKDTLKKTLGSWKSPRSWQRISYPYVQDLAAGLTPIQTPDKKMATVSVATNIQLRDDHPDYAALVMVNYILGGSSSARLIERLRQKEGYSYGAWSSVNVSPDDTNGQFRASAICAPENADKALAAMKEEIQLFIDKGVTPEELERFKAAFALAMQRSLADEGTVMGMLHGDLYKDRTLAYQQQLWDAMQALTPEQVQAAARTYIQPSRFVEVKAGDLARVGGGS